MTKINFDSVKEIIIDNADRYAHLISILDMLLQSILRTRHIINKNLTSKSSKMTETKCVFAVCQMTATNDKDRNYQIVENLVHKAKAMKANMIFLPEACDFISASKKETLEKSESLDGPLMTGYKNLALKNNVWISIGGFHELTSELEKEGKTYNTHAIINNHGELKACYRKLHLFDVLIPEKNIDLRESKITKGGSELLKPIETPGGNLGLSICYDLRFPEISTLLRKAGANVLTYPSAFTHTTGEAHWESLLRARAIENQCYVVAAAQVGEHNPKRISYGNAMIIDPWGRIVAQLPKYSESYDKNGSVAIAEIKSSLINKIEEQMPVFQHRRNDVYTLKLNDLINTNGPNYKGNYKFSNKPIPDETVFFHSSHSFAFTNIRCVLPGHVLIASKRIVPKLNDLTDDEIANLFQTARRVQNIMEKVHSAHSSTIVVQDGMDAGQTIPHVHIHILPRKQGDFKRNDDIYDVLAKHDTEESKMPLRQLAEMIAEATELKPLFFSS